MGLFSRWHAVLLFYVPLVLNSENTPEAGRNNFTKSYEEIFLLCQKEEFRFGSCLFHWLRCHYRKDCGRDYMLMKLICSVSSNQSSATHAHPECRGGGSEASLLVSPLVVAGIVIGLVLFLSCVTIIVGSLRKDSRLRNPHLSASYGGCSLGESGKFGGLHPQAPDGFSYGGSIGELRSTCIEEFPPVFDYDSYTETLSQVNVMYPDSPPRYDECVSPGATQIYVPTDDPPPYSLTDPCPPGATALTLSESEELPAGASWLSVSSASHFPLELQDMRVQTIASISLSPLPTEEAPPYEAVVGLQNHQPLPMMPVDLLKHAGGEQSSSQQPTQHRVV